MQHERSPQVVIDRLTYCNYRYNRQLNSGITPEQWKKVYGVTAEMETEYRKEMSNEQETGLRSSRNPSIGIDRSDVGAY